MIRVLSQVRLKPVVSATIVLGVLLGCGSEEPDQAQAEPVLDTTSTVMADRLTAKREAFRASAPEEILQIGRDAIETLEASGILERVLKVGDTIPRFELEDALGERVNVTNLLTRGPLVLVFYRGNW